MPHIDLSDVTFTIPVSIESEDRQNNLTILLDYLNKYFDTNVVIGETGKEMIVKTFWKPEWSRFSNLFFMEESCEGFHKTRLLNSMAKMANTDVIVSHDADVLLAPQLYVEAAQKIRNRTFDFCYPFDKPLKHIRKKHVGLIRDHLNLDAIDNVTRIRHPGIPPGGCFFMNREKFVAGGMENENMVSWGPEDQERTFRLRQLGYRVGSIDGCLYHLDHVVTSNSFYTNPFYYLNVKEFKKVKKMSRPELEEYVRSFKSISR